MAGVYHLARHFHVPPDAVTEGQLREYLLYLIQERQLAPSSVNLAVCALRAFYQWVLHRDLAVLREALPRMILQIHRPRVYSHQEIERLLSVGATAGKPRVFLMTVYGAGLRLNEACHLQVKDLDPAAHGPQQPGHHQRLPPRPHPTVGRHPEPAATAGSEPTTDALRIP